MGECTVEQALMLIGPGTYQWRLFIIAGLGFTAEAIQTSLMAFLQVEALKEWPGVSKSLVVLLSTSIMVGELVGDFIWGPLADWIGRKPTIFISQVLLSTMGVVSAMAPSFEIFLFIRTVTGVSIGAMVVVYDNLYESMVVKEGTRLTYTVNYFWSAGSMYVSFAAMFVLPGGWRLLCVLAAVPLILAVIGNFWQEESAKWLMTHGSEKRAKEVLQKIASLDGKDVSKLTLEVPQEVKHPSYLELCKHGYCSQTCAFAVMYFLGTFSCYALAFATPLAFEGGEGVVDFREVFFSTCGDFAGIAIGYLMIVYGGGSLGSKVMRAVSGGFAVLGISSLVVAFLKETISKVFLALVIFLMRASSMWGVCAYWTASPLAYPTFIRTTSHSFFMAIGRCGGILATLVPPDWSIEFRATIFAGASFIIALLAWLLKSTVRDEDEVDEVPAAE